MASNGVMFCRNLQRLGCISLHAGVLPAKTSSVATLYRGTLGLAASRSAAAFPSLQICHRSTLAQQTEQADDNAFDNANSEKRIQQNIDNIRGGNFQEEIAHPEELTHFRSRKKSGSSYHDINTPIDPVTSEPPIGTHALPHPIWSENELHSVKITHKTPERFVDRLAYGAVQLLRSTYDVISGYNRRHRDEKLWINRICFLETIAGVPGMVAAMVRHLDSLRKMRRDHGWIHTLLEEAENERMHLMTALQLKQPGLLFRGTVMMAQGTFVTMFSFAYMLSPRFCHRLVGYLEEEAVKTYSKLLKDMESGSMQHWNTTPAPELAIRYWALPEEATMKDVVLVIRADEAHHRVVNHTLGSMKSEDYNPYKPGQ